MTTILVVEDEPEITTMITAVLESDGHRVVTADRADRAWEILESDEKFDLVVCDFCLPQGFLHSETSAFEGAGLITSIGDSYPELPIIGMSALVPKENVESNALLRVFEMLQKPFKPSALLETVKAALATRTG